KAQASLARRYAAGEGVKQDMVEALFWMIMAADQNLPRAVAGREEISAGMSAAEIDAAEERVRAWKAGSN
ncbi:MAG TPA: SEL1-like repeat protein, partial [Alphaproteobacteria bacterium]|nr:SEL1-like repeat protein [Alphaproteobacteria bacterium]